MGAAGRPECWALPVVPNPGTAGHHEYGRCRSSRIRALPVVPLPATTGKASWRLERSTDRETAISGGRPVGNRVAGAMTDFGSGNCGTNTGNASWGLVWRCQSSRIRALPVVPNPGATAGHHEYGRCRSSRIRVLPVVPLPATTGKASWRLDRSTDRETAISGGTARRQPRCCSDDRFWERKVRDEDWERELELGLALPFVPNAGATGGPEYWALRVVPNPGAAGRRECWALPIVPLPATTRKASWRLERSTDRETAISGGRPVGNRVAGAMTDFGSGKCGANTGNASWSLVGRCRSTRMLGAAGRPQSGRCRSSRIRALPVVANPSAAGRRTASDTRKAS